MINKIIKYNYYILLLFLFSNLIYSQSWCPPSVDESNRALQFDGINDFVDLPYIFDLNDDFTISFWFKKSTWGSGVRDIILCQKSGSSTGRTIIGQDASTSINRRFVTYMGGSNQHMQQGTEKDKWTHIALVHDTSGGSTYTNGELQWYYNGIEVGPPVNVSGATSNNAAFVLGKNRQSSNFYQGLIDEFRIWDTKRTFAQIQSDLHGNADPLDPSLLVHYNMETVTSTVLVNNSSYGATYNGTLRNGTVGTAVTPNNLKLTTFAYGKDSYNKAEANPLPTIFGSSSGSFSSSCCGLSLNTSTGEIDLSASSAGSYNITYSDPSSCSSASNRTISITASDTQILSYSCDSYSTSSGNHLPDLTPGGSGFYYSDNPGLFLDKDTGEIDTSKSHTGTYQVYYSSGANSIGSWSQIGSNITDVIGSSGVLPNNNRFGKSVRLNAAGNVLIVGSSKNNDNSVENGRNKVFYNDNGTWVQVGHKMQGEGYNTNSDWDKDGNTFVDINDKGNIIAYSNPSNDSSCTDCGRVIVLELKNGIWTQMGNEIYGTSDSINAFGRSISLNAEGNVLAIGDQYNDGGGTFTKGGAIHIYEYNNATKTWALKGNKIEPANGNNRYWGWAVDLNANGNTVLVTTRARFSYRGLMRVFEFDGANWNQKGNDKPGGTIPANKYFGQSGSINAEGNVITVGHAKLPNNSKGKMGAYIYNESSDVWDWHIDNNVTQEGADKSFSSWSLAINDSGSTIIVGEPNNATENRVGNIDVWKLVQDGPKRTVKKIKTINGSQNRDRFGYSVDINAKGDIIAIGAPNYNVAGGNQDEGMVKVYKLQVTDNYQTPFKIEIVNPGADDPSFTYSDSLYNQSDSSVSPTITNLGGTFTVTPTYSSIQYPGQWGPSGDYYLSIDSTTGVISPSVSLAGTYSITYTLGCQSSTISMTIRSVNDIDHTLTYSPTTVCISDGGNLRPTIIPITTHYVVPRIYLDPGNINSYADEGNALNNTPITNITTNSAYNHWSGNWSNNADHHPDFRLLANPGDVEHIPGYSWKINTNHQGNSINNSGGGNLRKFFPRLNFSASVWVNETDWTNDAQIFDWANGDMNSGQVEFYYESSVPWIRIHNDFYQMGDFLPNNNQWYNFVITRQTDGPDGLAILKFYVNGELKHTETGTDNRTLDDRGDIHFGRNQGAVNNTNTSRAFIGQFGPIKIFNDPISPSQVEYEFDSFAPRYLTDSFNSTPAGLSIDNNTGVIDVASSTAGTYSVTLSWTEPIASTLQSAQTSITIEIGDASFTYPGSPTLNQGDTPITPIIAEPGGTFTVTPTHGGIYYANQWGPSGAYYLSIDPTTGVVSPSVSLAGTYSITYTLACDSTTRSITIRSVNDIDHTLTYSPTTACLTDGGNLRPIIIPTTAHSLVPRIYLDPGNINSYADVGSATNLGAITNLTTNNAYTHWNGNVVNTSSLHPEFELRVNGTDIEHIPGYSWKIKTNNKDNTITNDDGNSSSFFPVDDFSVSIWVKEENWNDGSKTYIFDWASAALTTGQIEFLYGNKGNSNCPDPNKACPFFRINSRIWVLGDFLPNNNQWYNFVITRSQKGPESTIGGIPFSAGTDFGILKFYVDGVLMHTEYGVDDNQLSNQGTISFGRNQSNRDVRKSTDFFIGEIGPIKIFDQVLSPSQVEYEFDSFAPRYLPDLFTSTPAGLSIDNTTGIIDVSSSVTGTYSVTVSWGEAIAATPHSGQTSITIESNVASITYPEITYCQSTSGTVTPTIIGITSGTFTSSPTGLSIVSSTGIITPELSSVATYTILFTSDGECPGTSSFTLAITDTESTSISYPEIIYCQATIGTVTPTITGVSTGTFTATPTGLIIDPITGIITPELSSVATYTIEYTTSGNCPGTSSFTLSITDFKEDASFNYPDLSYCKSTIGTVTPTITGVSSGSFTASPTGLIIDPITGIITPELSAVATYTVEYTTPGICPTTSSVTFVIKQTDDSTFNYSSDLFCKGLSALVTPTILSLGGTFTSSPTGLSIDSLTGLINPEISITGVYSITYTNSSTFGCVSTTTISITIAEKASGTLTYPHEDIILDAKFCAKDANIIPTVSSTVSGTFSSSPGGLDIDPISGKIKFESSAAGNYTVLYEMPSLYCGTTTISKTIVIKGSCDGSDSDGDGVPDVTEILPPETDPFDGCDYYFLHQHQDFVSPAWAASDCDGDGVTNGDELGDNTDPNNACSFKRQSITLPITTNGLDCDGDGVPGYKEEAEDKTDSINSCSLIVGNISLIVTSLEDCDGDGVSNADEASDKTNPIDGCSFSLSRSGKGKTKGWEALDCDGDGVLNGNEEKDGTDVFNNCSYYLSSMTINPTKGFDCDGDGVTNWQEVQSFTDPTDECDLDPLTIDFEISNEWYETDCDGDNFKNSVDVFPFYKLEWFDTDNDLVGNNQDIDDDNDGIIDSEEGDNDLDNDGISNAMDTDSDGDGCPDAIEAGYTDPDNNGILGSGDVQVDLDGKVLSNGGYSQIADNDSNNIYDYLEFGSKVDIITNPNKTYEIYRQSSIEISVTAEAKSTISYKWQLNKNGASISSKSNGWEDINDSQDYTGTKTNKLSILNPQFSMEGWNYRLVTSSPCYVCGGETISDPAELIISELFIPNAFSPDGDGINDTWTIRGGLYNYPNNNLVIFNRWGLKVYEADGYNNNWDGNNKGNSNSGNDSKLPSGTYFYVLDLNGNGKNVKKGFIYLTRLNE